MPIIVQCPACERKLRVPDELLGKQVKCPGCGGTFTGADTSSAAAPKPEPKPSVSSGMAALDDLNLELDEPPPPPPPPRPAPAPPRKEEKAPPPVPRKEEKPKERIVRPAPAPEPIRPKPASKAKPKSRARDDEEEDDGKEPCPYCGERIKPSSIRCKYCGEELDDEEDEEEIEERPSRRGRSKKGSRRGGVLPHRGGMIMSLGIISVCLLGGDALGLCCCGGFSVFIDLVFGAIGLGLGIPAWIMGQRDLAKMRAGIMDPRGKGSTQGGWICGIIGTILHGLALIGSVVLFIFLMMMFGASALTTPAGGMGSGPSNPFGPPPGQGPGRKFSVEPGERKLWHYLPSRTMEMFPGEHGQ